MTERRAGWQEANRAYLEARLDRLRAMIPGAEGPAADGVERFDEIAAAMSAPPALRRLADVFELSAFEEDTLLLAAAAQLDPSFAALCPRVSFGLAMEALPESHWSAVPPTAPLRWWRLIELEDGTHPLHTTLSADERVLHFLAGADTIDARLEGLVRAVGTVEEAPASHRETAREAAARIRPGSANDATAVYLAGASRSAARSIAAAACAELGLELFVLSEEDVPAAAAERAGLARLWRREARLAGRALLIETAEGGGRAAAALLDLLEEAPAMLAGRRPASGGARTTVRYDFGPPTFDERRSAWEAALGAEATTLNGELGRIASQFGLGLGDIREAAREATGAGADGRLGDRLWQACRGRTRGDLDHLAERIETHARWRDLVVEPEQRTALENLALQVRHQATVFEEWGFAGDGHRRTGVSAIFAGPSGTGKTLAAEVIAGDLGLDLYRVDLSQIVSKYVGETEKNLNSIFDVADQGGCVLLFDEADALFGKRSEVKDSHDRYANIEVSYLLQRMESYRGLAILTTNQREAVDRAFLRRIRFAVSFRFPDAEIRAEIWRRTFPERTPLGELDWTRLGRLQVSGGNIRNIAVHAAFLAAEDGSAVEMSHLMRAAVEECAKLEKPVTQAEIGGWL